MTEPATVRMPDGRASGQATGPGILFVKQGIPISIRSDIIVVELPNKLTSTVTRQSAELQNVSSVAYM